MTPREIELLAPAKGLDAVRAAIDHGADAVYMGATRFGARAAANNSLEDVARAVDYAHQYGARIYTTLNTLIFDNELAEAERTARELVDIGVDALIVQDMAFARMNLGVEFHCSTQMCNATLSSVNFLAEAGFSRVVLERNLSLEQISEIAQVSDVELEVFVHGAICVGHSGRCYLSRAMTPSRSGNRGECSQPCRLPYDLVNGGGERLVSGKHLLSVKDLNLSQRVDDLLDAGATSLKIEGRLKELSYIKNIVAHYRRVVDCALEQRPHLRRSSRGRSIVEFEPNPAKSFSRGETTYMLDGGARGVASFETPKALGERVGEVVAQRGERIEIRLREDLSTPLATGDGVCFLGRDGFEGSSVNGVEGGAIRLNRAVDLRRGTELYRNYDRLFEAAVESSRTRRVMALKGYFASTPRNLTLEYRDEDDNIARVVVEGEFEGATNRDKMAQVIVTQTEKCGDTIFDAEADISGWGGEFVPSKMLSQMRRDALAELRERRLERAKERAKRPFVEKIEARYPESHLSSDVGVTNHLAEAFYRDHGVSEIEPSMECAEDLSGGRVMTTAYCIRREIGECLKERGGKGQSEELFLERGAHRFRLDFDCAKCRMTLIKV